MPNFKFVVHKGEAPESPTSVVACSSTTKTARTGRRSISKYRYLLSDDDTSNGLVVQGPSSSIPEEGQLESAIVPDLADQEQTDFPAISLSYTSTSCTYNTDDGGGEWVTQIEYYSRDGTQDMGSKPTITTIVPFSGGRNFCVNAKNNRTAKNLEDELGTDGEPIESDPDILVAHKYFDNKMHKKLTLSALAAMSMVARSLEKGDVNEDAGDKIIEVEGVKADTEEPIETDTEMLVAHMYFDKTHKNFLSVGSATMSTATLSSGHSSLVEVGTLIKRISNAFWECSGTEALENAENKEKRRIYEEETTIGTSFSSGDENEMSTYASTFASTMGDGGTTTIATGTSRYDDDTLTFNDTLTYNETSTYNDTLTYNDSLTYNDTLTQTLEGSLKHQDLDELTFYDGETLATEHEGLKPGEISICGDDEERDKAEYLKNEDSSYGSGSFVSPLSNSCRSNGQIQLCVGESASRSMRQNSNFRITLLPPDIGTKNSKIDETDSLSYTKSHRFNNTDLINSFIELKSVSVSFHNSKQQQQQQQLPAPESSMSNPIVASLDEVFTVDDVKALERYETEVREEQEPNRSEVPPEPVWRNFDARTTSPVSLPRDHKTEVREEQTSSPPEVRPEPVWRTFDAPVPTPASHRRDQESPELSKTDFSSKNVKITVVDKSNTTTTTHDVKAIQPEQSQLLSESPPEVTQPPPPSGSKKSNSSHARSRNLGSIHSRSISPFRMRNYGRDDEDIDDGDEDDGNQRFLEDARDGPDGTTTESTTTTPPPPYRPAGRMIILEEIGADDDGNESPTTDRAPITKKKTGLRINTGYDEFLVDGAGVDNGLEESASSPKCPENLTPMARLRNPISYEVLTFDK